MNNIVIRRYNSSDNEKVKNLYKLASIHSEIGYRDGPWYKDLDEIDLFYFDGGDFLIGSIDNEIIATAGLQRIDKFEGHVRRMRVHPDHRRKGYGLALLNELEKIAKQLGLKELRLRTSTQQKMAQGLYEKNGYKKMPADKKEYYAEGGGNTFEVIWYRKVLI